MENGAISDVQITASSQFDTNHAAIQGRLHFQATGSLQGAWSAHTNDANQWLQVYLGSESIIITKVATQGRNGSHRQWVTKYNLQYSEDEVNFRYYREQGKTEKKVKYIYLVQQKFTASYKNFRACTVGFRTASHHERLT